MNDKMSIGNCGSVGKGKDEVKKGMYMYIPRGVDAEDSTLGGWSSQVCTVFVYGKTVPEIFEPGPNEVRAKLEENAPGHLSLSADHDKTNRTMFGGNFAYSPDSRMPAGPIKIMDRVEK